MKTKKRKVSEMHRIPEPELMDSVAQTQAYAEADFSDSNALFVDAFVQSFPNLEPRGSLVDLGCGPADICIRMARAIPGWQITGVDAGENMLKRAAAAVNVANLESRVNLRLAYLPDQSLPSRGFNAVISNSLLHHLPSPATLWDSVRQLAAPGAAITIMDLVRPASTDAASAVVERYAADAPQILQEDFYNSLLAAYSIPEILAQLQAAGMGELALSQPSDRHWMVSGVLPA
jgi:cyclopropane fatty-acyl-phospholipid synthase-like methyltransferase